MKCEVCQKELKVKDKVISVDEYEIRTETGMMYEKNLVTMCTECWIEMKTRP